MTVDDYKEEAHLRLSNIIKKYGDAGDDYYERKEDISFLKNENKDYVVAISQGELKSYELPGKYDVTEVLCIPIEDGKLSDDGMLISASSRAKGKGGDKKYNYYLGGFTKSYPHEAYTELSIRKEAKNGKGCERVVAINDKTYINAWDFGEIFSYVKDHRWSVDGRIALDICERFISPAVLERRMSSPDYDEEKINRVMEYRKLKKIVEKSHKANKYAGKLHKMADKKKKEERGAEDNKVKSARMKWLRDMGIGE